MARNRNTWDGQVLPVPGTMTQDTKRTPQGRSWCATLWTEEDVGRLKAAAGINALVVGQEICPETKKVHYQTYVRFESNKRFAWWKNQFPTAHVELRRGSEAEAAQYCRKDGHVLVDFGCSVDSEEGSDTTEHVLNMLEDSAPLWQIYRAHRKFFFHNFRKINDLDQMMKAWRENGHDPKRYKSDPSMDPAKD